MTAVYEKKVCASCGTSWTAPPDYCPSCEPLRKHAVPMRSDEAAFPTHALSAFGAYEQATIALRDAELALKAAQEGYRRALEALNKAIAPFPSEAL